MARFGSFNWVSWLALIPLGLFKVLTTQCNYAGRAYDYNHFWVPFLLIGWLVLSNLDVFWLIHLSKTKVPGLFKGLRKRCLLNAFPLLLICLGLLALPAFIPWYVGVAAFSTVPIWFYNRRYFRLFPRLKKKSIFLVIVYFLILLGPGSIIVYNNIGAVECTSVQNVMGNMHSLQTTLAYDLTCPVDWQSLKKKPYWKAFINPFVHSEEASIIDHPKLPESGLPPYIELLGIRFNIHRRNAGAVSYEYIDTTHCKIYGFDGYGKLIRKHGMIFFLTLP